MNENNNGTKSPAMLIFTLYWLIGVLVFQPILVTNAQASDKAIPANLKAEDYYAMGLKYSEDNNFQAARAALTRVTQMEPTSGMGKSAQEMLSSHLPRYPITPGAFNEVVRSTTLIHEEKLDEAITMLEGTTQKNPKFEWAYYNLACAYLAKGNISLAKAYAQKAVTINPCYSSGWAAMAEASFRSKNYPEAKRFAQLAIKYDSENTVAPEILKRLPRSIR